MAELQKLNSKKDKIFIELLPDDINFVNLYSYKIDAQTTSVSDKFLPIKDSFVNKVSISEVGDLLNNAGGISKVTVFGNNPKALFLVNESLDDNGIQIEVLFNFEKNNFLDLNIDSFKEIVRVNKAKAIYENADYYYLNEIKFERFNLFYKRLIDIIASFIGLIVLSPLFIVVSIAIKCYGANRVFYKPIRVGKHGKPFKMYKFKSMFEDDYTGLKATVKNDPRITPIGKIIRRHNIDELPQLFNVLLGDMSLVGPRPHRVLLSKSMQEEIPNYSIRYFVKPGITGWAQANGWRGPTETHEQRINRTLFDIFYVGNWNIFFDFKILFLTLFGSKVKRNAF